MKKIAAKWPCVFRDQFLKEQVNHRLVGLDKRFPFASFQRIWRTDHCATINPYGSESCPYAARDCAIAYYKTAREVVETEGIRSREGYFRLLARNRGLDRAENKPLTREAVDGTQGPGRSGDSDRGVREGRGVRGPLSRPQGIGELLGSIDNRTREVRVADGRPRKE